jgi:hypothetical protein
MRSGFLIFVLVANVVWFGAAFEFFSLRPRRAVRILIPRSAENETSAQSLIAGMPFLGGFNLAFAILSATFLFSFAYSHAAPPPWQVYAACAVAHATQWATNVPHALRGGRSGGAPWDVMRGLMLFIFIVDGACALLNAVATVI